VSEDTVVINLRVYRCKAVALQLQDITNTDNTVDYRMHV